MQNGCRPFCPPVYRVVIRDDVAEFVAQGKNVFAKHVIAADPDIRAGDDVLVVAANDRLIACGAAQVSGSEMLAFNYGVAVKVRQGSLKKCLPGNINPRQMKAMMKKLGMQVEQIEDVESIVIKTPHGNYIFDAAEVSAMTMQGVTTYQINGQARFEPGSGRDSG